MANQPTGDGFADNLGKIYGICSVGFVAFIILLAILEQVGIPEHWIGYLFLIFVLTTFGGFGLLARTMQVSDYYIVSRRVPAFYNGLATAGAWVTVTGFVSLGGFVYATGFDAFAYTLGLTGGFVLIATLIAPYLRKFGAYTIPDFLGRRYGGHSVRFASLLVVIACSFLLLAAQIRGAGLVIAKFTETGLELAVIIALIFVILGTLLGGMRAVTWGQVAQYTVVGIAFLVPVIIISTLETGLPLPHLMYGQVMQKTQAMELQYIDAGLATIESISRMDAPFSSFGAINFLAITFSLMVGTASMPFLLMRSLTAATVNESRRSNGWAMVFIVLIFTTAPVYAVFFRAELYQSLIGVGITELPDWLYSWIAAGQAEICGISGVTDEDLVSACRRADTSILRVQDISIARDSLVLSTPELFGLPYVFTGLLGAGALAAALATANGLMIAVSSALSQDFMHRMIDANAPTARRMIVARAMALVTAIAAALAIPGLPEDILKLAGWSFALAASAFFPALVLGIWWKRCNALGAITGMGMGFGTAFLYIYSQQTIGFGLGSLDAVAAGAIGVPVGFAFAIGISLLTARPDQEIIDLVEDIRTPRGRAFMDIDRERRRAESLQS